MESGLKGKVILITGAGSGIGRATALAFANEGADLALLDLDRSSLESLESEVKHRGVKVGLASADLSSEPGVNSGIDKVLKPFGEKVDVLVNNVGAGSVRRFDEISDEEWKKTFDLNFLSAVRASRKILPIMRKNRSGVIVNNASDLPSAGSKSNRLCLFEGGIVGTDERFGSSRGTLNKGQCRGWPAIHWAASRVP